MCLLLCLNLHLPYLSYLLERCLDEGINILVLPELTIDGPLLVALKKWLLEYNREKVSSGKGGLIMVVAGSFHFHNKGDIIIEQLY